jgi:hypothetical protein
MWWHDLLWGLWNGLTGWIVLVGHLFGAWDQQPVYDSVRRGNWYDAGFLVGAASPLLWPFGKRRTTIVHRSG